MKTVDQVFRCPFELKGVEKGTIVVRRLSEDLDERLLQIRSGLDEFCTRPESPGLRLVLPPSLLARTATIRQLYTKVLPYQAEAIAVEMDRRFYPLLPYQLRTYTQDQVHRRFKDEMLTLRCAAALADFMSKAPVPIPNSVMSLAGWVNLMLATIRNIKGKHGSINVGDSVAVGNNIVVQDLLLIKHAGLTIPLEQYLGRGNSNLFNIVKAPFYKKSWGRYSEDIEIVISREADIDALAPKVREQIRVRSNRVLRAGGVPIRSLKEDKQSTGVWVPEEK